jgi:hypothetical protein
MKSRPIHVTEIETYLRCALLWFWGALPPYGMGLEPKAPKPEMHLGRVVHAALQEYYDRGIAPDVAYIKIAAEEMAKLPRDMWPEEVAEIQEQSILGLKMLQGYAKWAHWKDQLDGFQPIATESRWEAEIAPGAHLAGRFDMVVKKDDGLWVMDFKTTSSTRTHWTARSLQATAYTIGAKILYGDEVRGVIFRFLRKKVPDDYKKLMLKDGSLTRKKTLPNCTTYENYLRAIAVAVLHDMRPDMSRDLCNTTLDLPEWNIALNPPVDDKDFHDQLLMARRFYWEQTQALKEDNTFFWDVKEERTDAQLAFAKKHILLPAIRRMTSKRPWVAPTGLGAAFAVCTRCPFRSPCQQVMAGADYKSTLAEYYQRR